MDKDKSSSTSTQQEQWRVGARYASFFLLFVVIILVFIGGASGGFYLLFSQYSGIRNIWLLVCGGPVIVVALGVFIIYNLYLRFGRPLRAIFSAIDTVAEGDLSVRVPADDSPQFSELIKRFNKMVEELESADLQRRNLTADVAHELRTPLHIIHGNLEGILDGVYDPTPEQIDNILEEIELLERLVDDLQTLSLAEAGQLPLHPSRFALADLFRDVAASFSAQAASQGIELDTRLADPDQQIGADYVRLNQSLANLVANALRYTPEGGMISIAALPAEAGRVRIQVEDTGSGIPAEDLPFIFDRFWRGEKARTREGHANSGLGLAITEQLIHAHGGTISVQSEVGHGTTFTIELPA